MKKEDAEEFTQSLGQIVAGSWRQIVLAKKLGVPKALGPNGDGTHLAWFDVRSFDPDPALLIACSAELY